MRRVKSTLPLLPVPAGINNVQPEDHTVFNVQEGPAEMLPPSALRQARDVDLLSDGKIRVRPGASHVRSVSDGKKLMARAGALFMLDGTTLYKLAEPASPTSIATSLSGSAQLLLHNWPTGSGQVLMACGTAHLRIETGVKSWGLPVAPAVTYSAIAGALEPATYLVAATFLDGAVTNTATQEGGAAAPKQVTLTETGGMRLVVLTSDPNVTHASFYVSGPDQPELFRVTTQPVLTSEGGVRGAGVDIVTQAGINTTETPLLTQGWGPPPAGMTALGSLQGFILAAVGKVLYRSWPGRPGLFYYGQAFQLFPNDIVSIIGLQEGAFVATTKAVYWLSGDRPENWSRRIAYALPIIPDGIAIPGEEFPAAETSGLVAVFASASGLLLGRPDGSVRPLTQDRYHFSSSRVSMTWKASPLRQLYIASDD